MPPTAGILHPQGWRNVGGPQRGIASTRSEPRFDEGPTLEETMDQRQLQVAIWIALPLLGLLLIVFMLAGMFSLLLFIPLIILLLVGAFIAYRMTRHNPREE